MTTNQDNIIYTVKHNVGVININRPEKANSFNFALLEELFNGLNEFDRDKKVKCIIINYE